MSAGSWPRKGIEDIEIINLDIFKGEHRDPGFLAKAGLPNVPALELEDGTTHRVGGHLPLSRSVYPLPNLFGRDPREVAIVEMWTRRAEMMIATPLMMACAMPIRPWPRSRPRFRRSPPMAAPPPKRPQGAQSAPGRPMSSSPASG
ncbi:hypothetical protein [Caulobacter sp. B11]|uniref:hypothetical protein n=1 Tax=Caulobacter sp. B11 TaxID=2048899 RepID=UPI0035153633